MAKKLILLMVLVWPAAQCFGDASGQLEQAEQLQEQGKFVEAEAIYKGVVEANRGTDDGLAAQEGLTKLYIKWGKEAKAEAACQGLIGQFSQHEEIVTALLSVAGAYRQAHNYEKAGALYRHAGDNHPESKDAPDCRRGLATCTILYAEQTDWRGRRRGADCHGVFGRAGIGAINGVVGPGLCENAKVRIGASDM